MRGPVLVMLICLAGCGPRQTVVVIPTPGPVGSAANDGISLSALGELLDDRMVDRFFARDRDTVEVMLCDQRRLLVAASPREVQAEMLERAYRPGCR